MALSAKELEDETRLRVLLMGPPKCGKTSMVVATSPPPVRVLLCEHDNALKQGVRFLKAQNRVDDLSFERIKGWNSMSKAMHTAKKDADAGEIGTLVCDPFSTFARVLEEECLKLTDTGRGPDGRRAYPEYNKRIQHILNQMFRLPCHLIVVSHYIDTGGGEVRPDDGGDPTPRTGEGIVPLLAGKARALVSAQFPDVVWMDYVKGERVLVTGPQGAWGPGCRSLSETRVIKADVRAALQAGKKNVGIKALLKAFSEPEDLSREETETTKKEKRRHGHSDRAHEKEKQR